MDRRFFLGATLGAAVTGLPARAQQVSLGALSQYLNGLQSARAAFTQVNADGTISTGTLYIRRPGRARFEYDPPEESLVMAGGGQVAIFDGKSNTAPEQFPLKRTPLNLILARQVDLTRNGMVVGHAVDGPSTVVTAQDPEFPEYGTIRLIFTSNPVELRQWVITDESGQQTTVILGKMETGLNLGNRLFNIVQEAKARGFD
ncbi:MAG: outer membrane lipoprotein carrier protein LolA [Pseudomonadota bacterium]